MTKIFYNFSTKCLLFTINTCEVFPHIFTEYSITFSAPNTQMHINTFSGFTTDGNLSKKKKKQE